MAVAFVATGTAGVTSGSGGNPSNPGLPVGHAANHILELTIHSSDNVVCSVNQGYTLKSARNGTATVRQEVWWKRDNGAEVAPVITHTGGDSCIARISAYSGAVTTGDPYSAFAHNSSNGTKTATSTDITPNANDVVTFHVTAAENANDTSGGTQGWATYSGTNPTFTERGDSSVQAGLRDLNGAEADGINTTGAAIGARTAVEGWSYTAATTDVVAGMFAITAAAAVTEAPSYVIGRS